MICIICYDKFKKETSLNCGHNFCKKCIEEWYNTNNTCPICRNNFSKQEIIDNIKGVKTRNTTRNKRYEKTNILFEKIVHKLNEYHFLMIENNNNISENMKEDLEYNLDEFFKLIVTNRNLYECKYKKKSDNICLNNKMCNYSNYSLKCRNCKFKYNIKKYINTTLEKINYIRLNEWKFKLNEVNFFKKHIE